MEETIVSPVCKHGNLQRQCLMCELEAENEMLRAKFEELNKIHKEVYSRLVGIRMALNGEKTETVSTSVKQGPGMGS